MDTKEIITHVEENFANTYKNFKDLQKDPENRKYWELCINAIADEETFNGIVFCNNVFEIPPVKSFLMRYYEELKLIAPLVENNQIKLPEITKRSIGAFWGMVFKFALEYSDQESVRITTNNKFNVISATFFKK